MISKLYRDEIDVNEHELEYYMDLDTYYNKSLDDVHDYKGWCEVNRLKDEIIRYVREQDDIKRKMERKVQKEIQKNIN